MPERKLPLLETTHICDVFTDGIARVEPSQENVRLVYYRLCVDPRINGGEPFRRIVQKLVWPRINLIAHGGKLAPWILSGGEGDWPPGRIGRH